jgi:hypothetical protein
MWAELLSVDLTSVGGWSLLILTWGFIVWCIVKTVLVPGPFYNKLQDTLETERATRQELEKQVAAQNAALAAIADGVESIKKHVLDPTEETR